MSEDFVPGPQDEAVTDEEHAHATEDAIPEDAIEQKQVHEETSPGQEPGDERSQEG
ncbi:MAG: hypothetical protein Q4G35_06235 [Propionibacteriaceae bacterium]|nr:hypothetical protein [Propionibacteriaceae bacterium]